MTATWTRRQLLARSATAAGLGGLSLGGLSLAGCGTRMPTRAAGAGARLAAPVAAGVRSFVSRPDLRPPAVTVNQYVAPDRADPSHLFLAAPASGPGQGGAMIVDRRGDLIWFSPDTGGESVMNFRAQSYRGQPVLTWFQGKVLGAGYGQGNGVIADSAYRTAHVIRAVSGLQADLHEFLLTDDGTALITAYRTVPADLTALGGPAAGYVLSGVVQEIDVATGKLVFQWDSLDHVPLTDTYRDFTGGTAAKPFDYFHINSIDVAPDGDLLVSARHTWAVYKIARPAGTVTWQLGGKSSSFTMGAGTRFYWQHDARADGPDSLTLFDDGAAPPREKQSRALILDLDAAAMTATLRREFTHPGKVLLAPAEGNAQLLPGGRMFVGWGAEPYFSEFGADGSLRLDGAITTNDPSYRSFTADWAGRPADQPAMVVQGKPGQVTAHVSWNGATGIAGWTVLAGAAPGRLARVSSVARTGFETTITVHAAGPYFAAEARDAAGHALSRSAAVRVR